MGPSPEDRSPIQDVEMESAFCGAATDSMRRGDSQRIVPPDVDDDRLKTVEELCEYLSFFTPTKRFPTEIVDEARQLAGLTLMGEGNVTCREILLMPNRHDQVVALHCLIRCRCLDVKRRQRRRNGEESLRVDSQEAVDKRTSQEVRLRARQLRLDECVALLDEIRFRATAAGYTTAKTDRAIECYVLKHYCKMTFDEVAAKMGVSVSTAWKDEHFFDTKLGPLVAELVDHYL